MKSRLEQDKKRRQLFSQYELKKLYYKFISYSNLLTIESKNYYTNQLTILPRNASISRIKNRCLISGRGRGVVSYYGVSRLCFRELVLQGKMPGVKKLSW